MSDEFHIFSGIDEYCETYNISREHLLDTLQDQKVLPIIRGKITEYIGAAVLRQALDSREWLVELNLQQGVYDNISITHRRTGKRLKAETKTALRGKFSMGIRSVPAPHFIVRCYKPRSNFLKVHDDRYKVGDFDVLLTNVSNSIFRGHSLDRGLPLIRNETPLNWLKTFYGASNDDELRRYSYDDWRACLLRTISLEDGTIPRTPKVLMVGDANWFGLGSLQDNLLQLNHA